MQLAKIVLLSGLMICSGTAAIAGNGKQEKKGGEPTLVSGVVSDADSKKPVSEVTVSISAKGQDKKVLVTDKEGNFKSGQLIAGEVTITLEKKGYRTFKKENVIIKDGASLKLIVELEQQEEDDDSVFHPLLRMLQGE